jgi:predicted phosphodiesterase
MTKYTDYNDETIHYGDILKVKFMEEREKSPYDVKTPFAMLVKGENDKDMMYISGMDEFSEISEWQKEEDRFKNKISSVEIFAWRAVYEANLNAFNK